MQHSGGVYVLVVFLIFLIRVLFNCNDGSVLSSPLTDVPIPPRCHSRCRSQGDPLLSSQWRLGRVEAELNSLESSLPKSPAVFSHNDLLAGNIMRGAETGDITLIDFE